MLIIYRLWIEQPRSAVGAIRKNPALFINPLSSPFLKLLVLTYDYKYKRNSTLEEH